MPFFSLWAAQEICASLGVGRLDKVWFRPPGYVLRHKISGAWPTPLRWKEKARMWDCEAASHTSKTQCEEPLLCTEEALESISSTTKTKAKKPRRQGWG